MPRWHSHSLIVSDMDQHDLCRAAISQDWAQDVLKSKPRNDNVYVTVRTSPITNIGDSGRISIISTVHDWIMRWKGLLWCTHRGKERNPPEQVDILLLWIHYYCPPLSRRKLCRKYTVPPQTCTGFLIRWRGWDGENKHHLIIWVFLDVWSTFLYFICHLCDFEIRVRQCRRCERRMGKRLDNEHIDFPKRHNDRLG